jgi:hypothetical protein
MFVAESARGPIGASASTAHTPKCTRGAHDAAAGARLESGDVTPPLDTIGRLARDPDPLRRATFPQAIEATEPPSTSRSAPVM